MGKYHENKCKAINLSETRLFNKYWTTGNRKHIFSVGIETRKGSAKACRVAAPHTFVFVDTLQSKWKQILAQKEFPITRPWGESRSKAPYLLG